MREAGHNLFNNNAGPIRKYCPHPYCQQGVPQRLEEVLHIFDQRINIIRNFDAVNPCKTTKKNQPKSVDPSRAYEIISKAMSNERTKVKKSN